jgi:hypothetical protein
MSADLGRRAVTEALGTALLLANTLATGMGLVTLDLVPAQAPAELAVAP